jgi:hypothetical protein
MSLANILRQMANEKSLKNLQYFTCIFCDYNTSKNADYKKHLLTIKHKRLMVANKSLLEENSQSNIYICVCNKSYQHMSSLCKHKQKCIYANINKENNYIEKDTEKDTDIEPSSKDMIKMMKMQMIENQEIRSLIIELLKKETISSQINNISNISNCNNKSFNLNFFLKEQCKDALNINEFVDSIKIQLADLEEFAHLGYADGVSNIFVKGINALEVHKRPIHCSDAKREVLYIKNNDEWIKETDDKPLIKNAIKRVAFKNIRQINEWVKENPTCKDTTTKKFDQYNKIVMNSMSGVTEEEQKDNIEKIVKNVTKAVVIEKYLIK